MDNQMKQAKQWFGDFFVMNKRMPKTAEDPNYKKAVNYFKSADNYRRAALMDKGFSEPQINKIVSGTYEFELQKKRLFELALTQFKEESTWLYGYTDAKKYYGSQFYLMKAVFEHLDYSVEDMLYGMKEKDLKNAETLQSVLDPLIQWIKKRGYYPSSEDYPMRGNIIKRFGSWSIAIKVIEGLENPLNNQTVDELFVKYRPKYNPNKKNLQPIIQFIRKNQRVPRGQDIKEYRAIMKEFIIWAHAIDLAMDELGYDEEKKFYLSLKK